MGGDRPAPSRFFTRHVPGTALLLGVVAPVLLVVADPVVFRLGSLGTLLRREPLLPHLAVAGPAFVGLEAAALLGWTLRPPRAPAWHAGAAAVFAVGALAAVGLGIALLPLAVVGLVAVIGFAGFVPFATAVVYTRAAATAAREARGARPAAAALAVAVAVAAVLGPPAVAYLGGRQVVHGALAAARSGDAADVDAASATLRRWRVLAATDDLVDAWEGASPDVRTRLAAIYRAALDADIAARADDRRADD